MNEFKNLHPLVGFLYFAAVISFSMFLRNPFCIIVSAVGAFLYLAKSQGGEKAVKALLFAALVIFGAALVNPIFSHDGATVITYLPGGSPLTAEAFFYGLCSGLLLACVTGWFLGFNSVMTSDKITYLFGKSHLFSSVAFFCIIHRE